jgi:uncharacterized protein YdaU (DUF1376 family)
MNNPFIAFYPSKWLARSAKLTAVERGVFITLICEMYESQAPIKYDPKRLARFCGTTPATLKKCVEELLQDEHKLILKNEELWNYRVEKELKTAQKKSGNQSKNSRARWEKHNKNKESAMPRDNPRESLPEPEPYNSSLLSASVNEETVNRMLEALGVTDETKSHGLLVWTEIFRWFENGCDLEKDILPVLKAKAAQGHKATNWAYFTKAIFQAKANRTAPPPTVEAKPTFQPFEDAVDRRRRKLKEKQQQEAGNVH